LKYFERLIKIGCDLINVVYAAASIRMTPDITEKKNNFLGNNSIKSDNIKINYSENKVSQNLSKNKNIDSESSIAYIDNDENYEDVFSNIADTDSTNIDSIKNILNSDNEKAKNKSVYFSHLN